MSTIGVVVCAWHHGQVKQVLGFSRFIVLVAVIGLGATTIASFGWGVAKSVKLIGDLLEGAWRDDVTIVQLLGVIDMYLLAVVQLIVTIGLYELFIDELPVPQWLRVDSLDGLKKSIIDVLIVYMGVKGIEGLLTKKDALDSLSFSGAVAILVIALTAFRAFGVARKS
ncbi:MAG: hypothetical protein RL419_1579 [Actinomycetota bacterium]